MSESYYAPRVDIDDVGLNDEEWRVFFADQMGHIETKVVRPGAGVQKLEHYLGDEDVTAIVKSYVWKFECALTARQAELDAIEDEIRVAARSRLIKQSWFKTVVRALLGALTKRCWP